MFFCELNLAARRLLSLMALVALGLPAAAQQHIQFSKPTGTDTNLTPASAFLPPKASKNPAYFNAPKPVFGGGSPGVDFDALPGNPQPSISGAYAAQWQKSMDAKKNWALMTPEEVLGIPTPEKILGVEDPNDKEESKLSAEERFLRRQQREADIGESNALRHADASMWHNNDWASDSFQTTDAKSKLDGAVPGTTRNLGDLFRQRSDGVSGLNQDPQSAWSSPFESPAPLPKPTPEQLAGMDRFRALMEPPPQDKVPQALQPVIAPDPNIQRTPFFNPAGQSFTRVSDNTVRPVGLTPLPGVTGPHPDQTKKQKPLVEPPPWMQSSLDGGFMPQRQF